MKIVNLDRNFENGTPARVHRPTGTVYLTPRFYAKYTPIQQRFIILHELGHYVKQTTDETEADKFAADILLNLDGYKATFRALNDSLHGGSVNDKRRIDLFNYLKQKDIMNGLDNNAVINNNREYDNVSFEYFEDENGCGFTNDYIGTGDIEELEIADYLNFCDYYGYEYSDMSKGEYRQQKRDAKIAKRKAKNDLKQSRADARRTRAEAKMQKANAKLELAKQGISTGSSIGNALSSVADTVGGWFGKKNSGDEGGVYVDDSSASGTSSKLPLIIGGAVAIVVVVIIIVVVAKKSKK